MVENVLKVGEKTHINLKIKKTEQTQNKINLKNIHKDTS